AGDRSGRKIAATAIPHAAAAARYDDSRGCPRFSRQNFRRSIAMLDRIPRYVAPFHPKRVPHRFADVLIIGGRLSGMRAARAVPPEQSVLVITKGSMRQSNSNYAQGGIASVIDPEDRFEDHIADTLTAGGALCDRAVVEMVVREAPARINELIEWGTNFDQHL